MQGPRRRTPFALRVGAAVVALVLVAAAGIAAGRASLNQHPTPGTSSPALSPFVPSGGGSARSANGSTGGSSQSPDASAVAAEVDPGVVDITTRLAYEGGEAAGTGMVLSSSGVVLTNNHVVEGATSISVTDVGNGRTYNASVVGTDKTDDIAVIQLQGASGLPTVSMGDSSSVSVGDAVTAIGNAGGVGGTPSVATGSVTALNQSITASDGSGSSAEAEQLSGLFQINAQLEPGDSGGPLVLSSGKVIGIDTAASSGFEFQAGNGAGFAIPIDKAITIAKQIQGGQASSTIHIGAAAFLGVEVQAADSGSGAQIVEVVPGSPADQAGLVAGDVIVSFGGQNVDSPTTLSTLIARYHPGDKVRMGWIDLSGQSNSTTVQVVTGPAA